MRRRSIPLAERLRYGLASAVLSAASLAAPAADAASPQQPRFAERPGSSSKPVARVPVSTSPQSKAVKTTPPKPSPSAKAKPLGAGTGAPAAAGCGAHDGGCGPSR